MAIDTVPRFKEEAVDTLFVSWSQIFLGILLMFHMTKHDRILIDIRKHLCGVRFEMEYNESVQCMLNWINELKDVDPISLWCWRVLQPIYC